MIGMCAVEGLRMSQAWWGEVLLKHLPRPTRNTRNVIGRAACPLPEGAVAISQTQPRRICVRDIAHRPSEWQIGFPGVTWPARRNQVAKILGTAVCVRIHVVNGRD